MKWFKSLRREKLNQILNDQLKIQGRIYNLEQGLYSAQKQLNQLYRVLWEYSHIVITHSEEEKDGLVQCGFVVIGQNVYDCFDMTREGMNITQRTYYILKERKEKNEKI